MINAKTVGLNVGEKQALMCWGKRAERGLSSCYPVSSEFEERGPIVSGSSYIKGETRNEDYLYGVSVFSYF